MKHRWLVARLLAWKYCWFQPLLALHHCGLIEWEQLEETAMAPLRNMR